MNNNEKWLKKYEYAKIFYEHYGNLDVHREFKTIDGYTNNENGITLGSWIHVQKNLYNNGKLSEDRIELLKKLKMNFENKFERLSWYTWYEYAKKYFDHYGDCDIKINFKTDDGYTYKSDGRLALGIWLYNQREFYRRGKLSEERIELLEKIKINFNNLRNKMTWEEWYNLAKIYYEHYDNLEIPYYFATKDGYTFDKDGMKLGNWVESQRKNTKIDSSHKKLLIKIGMRFENKNKVLPWNEWYDLANNYFKYYGNLNIKSDFKTMDGYTYDELGFSLGRWLVDQRHFYKIGKLSLNRIDLLNDIGAKLDNHLNDITWEEYYKYATIYYNYYKNLNIKRTFKTDDGFNLKKDGKILLGNWIFTQKELYKKGHLTSDKIIALENIGMLWTAKQNNNEIIKLCNDYNIEFSRNKSILKHITIQELYSKIQFLIDNNIPLIDDFGVLHEIFSLSSDSMLDKYGYSLINLIDTYYKVKTKIKTK